MHLIAMLSCIAGTTAMTLLGSQATAEWTVSTACDDLPEGTEYCVAVVACFSDNQNITFVGRATGATEGSIFGATNEGVLCRGTWVSDRERGYGRANFECADGRKGYATYTSIDLSTGTTIGSGVTEDGVQIRAWSGNAIKQFMQNGSDDINARLMCNGAPTPIS